MIHFATPFRCYGRETTDISAQPRIEYAGARLTAPPVQRGILLTPKSDKRSKLSLSEMIATSPIAAVISDPRLRDNPIIDCNQAFMTLTGYTREEIIGRNCRFLSGPKTEPDLTQVLRNGIAQRRPIMVEITNYKKDGAPFRNAVMVAPIFDADERLEYFLGSQVEVQDSRAALRDARVKAAGSQIEKLTARQRQILAQMLAGRPNKVIAAELNISSRTVKMHVAAVLRSLNVRTRADAIRLAVEAGF